MRRETVQHPFRTLVICPLLDGLVVLRAAVDGVLALEEVAEGEAALHEFVVGVQREQHRLVVAAAPAVRSWERSGVWG